jgi:hypothetical protein
MIGAPRLLPVQPGLFTRNLANKGHMLCAALLDMLPFGVIVLSPKSKALHTNAHASEVLHSGANMDVVDGFLRARFTVHSRALHEAPNRLANEAVHEPIGFNIARADQRPIAIVLAKLAPRTKNPRTNKSRIAVFVYDPAVNHHASALVVRELFHFTPVESSIAIFLICFYCNVWSPRYTVQLGVLFSTIVQGSMLRLSTGRHLPDVSSVEALIDHRRPFWSDCRTPSALK